MIEIRQVRIEEIIFRNEENGYTVAVAEYQPAAAASVTAETSPAEETEGEAAEYLTVVGCLPPSPIGRVFRLTGTYKAHPRFGEQYAFTEFEEIMPTSEEGIEGFLASGILKGIGKKTARMIVARFGSDTFRVLEQEPGRLTEVDGIGEVKAKSIREAFAAHREFAEVTLFFQQFGISADYALKLYKVYGADTVRLVSENPYRLVDDVFGIGFRKADSIAEKMGILRDDENRIRSAVKYALGWYAGEGHTYVPQKELCEKTAELLELSAEQVEDAVVALAFAGDLRVEEMEGRRVVYPIAYHIAERNVAICLKELSEAFLVPMEGNVKHMIAATEAETGILLSKQQKYAVASSLENGVSVITGGPGTGKTTIINTIMNILKQCGRKTEIAAPTGRAAKRITETSGHPARTIHRLLEYSYSEDGGEPRFGRNRENQLDCDAVIIDEVSMVDILLMSGLLSALRPGTRLILVGDADQLPSVGAGNVLRDILDSEYIYAVRLTEIFRQAAESLIVVNAHRINRGEYPEINEKDKDFFLMRISSEKEMLFTIKDLLKRRLPVFFGEGFSAVRDIQVLTPVRKGLLGCINLNRELQEVLNPQGEGAERKAERKHGDRIFRVGDKVMQIRNDYEMKWKRFADFTEGSGVFNGDIGFVEHMDTEFQEMSVVFDDDRCVTYDFTQLDELELAYAVTVHKSQGSEFPVVVMPVSWFPPVLATRNLLYTAVTRGKRTVVLVGSENKMNAMIDNNRISARYSGLSVRLKAFLEDAE